MAPRGRPRSGKSRMDAAIHAMKQFGFEDKVVIAKMRELLKTYDGEYGFIEIDAYHVLLEALIDDQEKEHGKEKNQEATDEETSNTQETVENERVEDSHPIEPTDGFIDIPAYSSAPIAEIPPPAPPPQQLPPPPPVLDASRSLPPLVTYATSPPPGFGHQRRRKPCHGWVTEDDEEPRFIRLISSLDGKISPPKSPPSRKVQPESTGRRNYRPRLRSRWDLKPEDM